MAKGYIVTDCLRVYGKGADGIDGDAFYGGRFSGIICSGPALFTVDEQACVRFAVQVQFTALQGAAFAPGEISGEIYDLTNNSAYDTNEINILVQTDDDSYLSEFMSEARRVVKEAHSVGYGYYNSNTTPAVSSAPQVKKNPDVKIGAKASARQGSLFDDTEEDDWYNDIYRGGNR